LDRPLPDLAGLEIRFDIRAAGNPTFLASPAVQTLLVEVIPTETTWSSTNPFGDPDAHPQHGNRQKQRKLVIQDLNLLAVYVQNVSNDDPVIFSASGFTAKPTGKSVPQPVGAPSFRSLDFGVNSGQIVVFARRQKPNLAEN
jgi:hypothetical protein